MVGSIFPTSFPEDPGNEVGIFHLGPRDPETIDRSETLRPNV